MQISLAVYSFGDTIFSVMSGGAVSWVTTWDAICWSFEKFANILSRGKEYNITEMTEGCGILFNLYFNTLIFVK
jgi:hypothetical protein